MSKELELEIGKRYIRRDGIITAPLYENLDNPMYPFTDGAGTWSSNGQFYTTPWPSRWAEDLIREYTPNTSTDTKQSDDPKVPEVVDNGPLLLAIQEAVDLIRNSQASEAEVLLRRVYMDHTKFKPE